MNSKLMTLKEFAVHIGVSYSMVRRMVAEKSVSVVMPRRRAMIPASEVARYTFPGETGSREIDAGPPFPDGPVPPAIWLITIDYEWSKLGDYVDRANETKKIDRSCEWRSEARPSDAQQEQVVEASDCIYDMTRSGIPSTPGRASPVEQPPKVFPFSSGPQRRTRGSLLMKK